MHFTLAALRRYSHPALLGTFLVCGQERPSRIATRGNLQKRSHPRTRPSCHHVPRSLHAHSSVLNSMTRTSLSMLLLTFAHKPEQRNATTSASASPALATTSPTTGITATARSILGVLTCRLAIVSGVSIKTHRAPYHSRHARSFPRRVFLRRLCVRACVRECQEKRKAGAAYEQAGPTGS